MFFKKHIIVTLIENEFPNCLQQEKYSFQSEFFLMFLEFIPLETSSYIWFTKSWTCTTLAIHVLKCTLWVFNFTIKSQCI
jgi:hypothetical protein